MEVLTLGDFLCEESPKAVLLDAYGVFWAGGSRGPLPGAREAMQHLKQLGIAVGVLSNASNTSAGEEAKVARHGLFPGIHYDFYLTSGEVARSWMRRQVRSSGLATYYAVGSPHPVYGAPHRAIMEEAGLQEVSDPRESAVLVCHIPHIDGHDVSQIDLFRPTIMELVELGKPLVCFNPDHVAMEGGSRPVVRQGALASLFESLGGEVWYVGKPYPEVFRAALEQFQGRQHLTAHDVWMIGDTPETDIRGAHGCGMRGVLTWETGVFGWLPEQQRREVFNQLPRLDRPDRLLNRFSWLQTPSW
jgi:HAD superfamily hydrolase (TIGR01459 family)